MDHESELHGTSLRRSRTTVRVFRSLAYRNVISAVLFFVAIAGIFEQVREIHAGVVLPYTRITLIAYILIAIYALASIVLRLRGKRTKP